MGTTPPTDLLYRANYITTAFLPVYSLFSWHSLLNLVILRASIKKILKFLWTRQLDGQAHQKGSLVALKRLSAGREMGGWSIPHPDEILQGFQQNLFQKIYQLSQSNTASPFAAILHHLLARADCVTLAVHIQRLGPEQWILTGKRLQPWNWLLTCFFKQ